VAAWWSPEDEVVFVMNKSAAIINVYEMTNGLVEDLRGQ
jgi:hypothetical protein